jgi:hypothetical protein
MREALGSIPTPKKKRLKKKPLPKKNKWFLEREGITPLRSAPVSIERTLMANEQLQAGEPWWFIGSFIHLTLLAHLLCSSWW